MKWSHASCYSWAEEKALNSFEINDLWNELLNSVVNMGFLNNSEVS